MRVVVCAVVGLLSSSPNLCPKQPLQLRIQRHAPQRSRHVNAAAALRRSSPALKRQAKRLALLADPDEPIAEEVAGLRLLGLLAGGAFGKLSDAVGPLMGLFFGFQLATVLAFQSGSAGDRIREAGWRANDVSMRAYARLKREVEERGYVGPRARSLLEGDSVGRRARVRAFCGATLRRSEGGSGGRGSAPRHLPTIVASLLALRGCGSPPDCLAGSRSGGRG